MSLSSFVAPSSDAGGITMLGAMLFGRCVSGTRVIDPAERKRVGPLSFIVRCVNPFKKKKKKLHSFYIFPSFLMHQGYGAHVDAYPVPYMTAAAALGMVQVGFLLVQELVGFVLYRSSPAPPCCGP